MKRLNNKPSISLYLSIFFAVGALGHLIPFTRGLMLFFTPLILLCVSILLFISLYTNKPSFYWALFLYLATFIIEVIGVKTGMIFGVYAYGSALGLKIFSVPLVIGLTWVLVIIGTLEIVKKFKFSTPIKILLAGCIAVIFDIFLEIAAVKLGYWRWADDTVPIQNYIAWFIITVCCAGSYFTLNLHKIDRPVIKSYFIIQICFFIVLALGL
jgi:bisanhydrobacterioruberin hydratase